MSAATKRVKTNDEPLPKNVVVADRHPVIQYKLAQLRKSSTHAKPFRELLDELTLFLGFRATEDLAEDCLGTSTAKIALVPIMRSGLGLVPSMLTVLPMATIHHIGMYNNPESLLPVLYYNKLPSHCQAACVIVLDVQIGSGATLIATVDIIKEWIEGGGGGGSSGISNNGKVSIKVVSAVAARGGLEAFCKAHPDVAVYLAAVDESGEQGLPVPGLGDPGARMFNAE